MFVIFRNWALKKVIWRVKIKNHKPCLSWTSSSTLAQDLAKEQYNKSITWLIFRGPTPKKVKLKWKKVIATGHGPLPTILESRSVKIPKVNSIYHEGITDPNHSLTPHIHFQITSHATLHHHCRHSLHL